MSSMTGPDAPLTRDAVLGGRLILAQPARGHRIGHDAILLSALAGPDDRTIIDFGAGVGGAGLAALIRQPAASAVLVEREPDLAGLAAGNAAANDLEGRCRAVCADVTALNRAGGERLEPADLVLANPPFNLVSAHRTSPDGARARAHMAEDGLLEAWTVAAARCLKAAGRLGLILRPSEMEMLFRAVSGRFGALEIRPVHPAPDRPAVRILARAIKGRRTPPALLPPLILADAQGVPSAGALAVLAGEPLAPS